MPVSKSKVKVQKSKVVEKVQKPVKTVAKVAVKKNKLSLDVFDVKGKVAGTVDLPAEIFGIEVNKHLIAQAVRVYLANQRMGTASTKTRGEVRGSTRKIYKQKGTGRARHGSNRAPIFVHGGIVFGPKPRDYSLDLPKKMRRKALFSALSAKVQDNQVKVVSGVEKLSGKTKDMVKVLSSLDLGGNKSKVLFVLPASDGIEKVVRAIRNIEGVSYMRASQMNTYEVLNNNVLLFMKEALQTLENTFVKGEK